MINSERGAVTIEGAVFIPLILWFVFLYLKLFFLWTEDGVWLGEQLVLQSQNVVFTEEKEDEVTSHLEFHFLKNPRSISIEKEHPMKQIRRRERVEEAVSKIRLP